MGVAWALGVDTTCEIMKSAIDVWLPMKGTECINALVLDGLNVKTSSKILSKARLKRMNLSGCPRFESEVRALSFIRRKDKDEHSGEA